MNRRNLRQLQLSQPSQARVLLGAGVSGRLFPLSPLSPGRENEASVQGARTLVPYRAPPPGGQGGRWGHLCEMGQELRGRGVAEGNQVAEGDLCLSSRSHPCLIPSSGGLAEGGGESETCGAWLRAFLPPDLGLARHGD